MRRLQPLIWILGLTLAAAAACKSSSDPIQVYIFPHDVVAAPLTSVQFEASIDGIVRQDVVWTIETIDDLALEEAGASWRGQQPIPAVLYASQTRARRRARFRDAGPLPGDRRRRAVAGGSAASPRLLVRA